MKYAIVRGATGLPGGARRGGRVSVGLGVVAFLLLLAPSAAALPAAATSTPAAAGPIVVAGDALTTLVPAPPDAPVLYAAGAAGFYRSEDAGATWSHIGPVPPDGRIFVAHDNPDLLLAGDVPPCARGGGEEPLERSLDAGATWNLTAGLGIRPVAVSAADNVALGIGCAGFVVSSDAGMTWQPAAVAPEHPLATGLEITSFAVIAPWPSTPGQQPDRHALAVGTYEGGSSSLFGIDLADPAAPRAGDALTRFWGLGALAGRDDRYVVGTAEGVRVSADEGATWTLSRAGLEDVTTSVDPSAAFIPEEEIARGFGIDTVAIHPTDPTRLYAGTVGGLFTSADAGATWAPVAGVDGRVTALVPMPTTGRLLAQTASGVVAAPLDG